MARRSFVLAVVIAILSTTAVLAATPPPVVAPPLPGGAVFDPRTIPSMADAQAALDEARAQLVWVHERIATLESQRATASATIESLGGESRALVEQVEHARRTMRVFAVESYVTGGPISELTYLIDAPTAEDFAWRQHMLRTSFDTTRDAAAAYDSLRDGVDDELVELAVASDRAAAELEAARSELPLAEAAVRDAELGLLAARHEDDHRTGRLVVLSGDDGAPGPDQSGNAAGPAWEALRRCEAGGNYARADRTGMFRGAYQFAVSTWYSMGGQGDPADGPPSEQDYRAQLLYDLLGAKPWPVCGRFLIEADAPRFEPLPGLLERLAPDQELAGPGITTPTTSTTTSTTPSISTTSSTASTVPEQP
jgi:hypothetical protein